MSNPKKRKELIAQAEHADAAGQRAASSGWHDTATTWFAKAAEYRALAAQASLVKENEPEKVDIDLLQAKVAALLRKLYPDASEFAVSEGSDDIARLIKHVME
jgi:hypothetical protein